MKRVLFVGNRPKVFEAIAESGELDLARILVLEGSFLHNQLMRANTEYTLFGIEDRQKVLDMISEALFDILISNGCPFVIPVSRIRKPHQLFINIHPSLLPDLRGCHPANGALLYQRRFTGATMHYMDDGVDTGNVIYQEKLEITNDLDLGLVYYVTFDLEARVFQKGMERLTEADYQYVGEGQIGSGRYYTRSEKDMVIDLKSMSDDEVMKRVRAFGLNSQGVTCVLEDRICRVFDAEVVVSSYLLAEFSRSPPGAVVLEYDGKLLVRTRDGIVKIKSYTEV